MKLSTDGFSLTFVMVAAGVVLAVGLVFVKETSSKLTSLSNAGFTYSVNFSDAKSATFDGKNTLERNDSKQFITIYPSQKNTGFTKCSSGSSDAGSISIAGKDQLVCKSSTSNGYVTSFQMADSWHVIVYGDDSGSMSLNDLEEIVGKIEVSKN